MLKPEIKFQCESCHGIVLADLEDELVNCGHCHSILNVPHKLGPGVVVNDFLLLKRIGTGGMGTVYLAHQFSLERECALKILMDHYVEDKHKNDFVIEARSVAKLNHINIVKAYKVGVDNGVFFFAMELVDGDNLKSLLRKKKTLSQEYVVRVAIAMVRALGYAWKEAKLVHRDVKPDNIMIAKDGTAKLMDLGLCRPANETEEDSEIVSGTPQYISPEQITGDALDIRSDFYSLGATMYHLLTGKFIFNGSVDEIIDKHLDEKPKSIKAYKPQINKKLDELILKLLAKKPKDRYEDADKLEKDLVSIQDNFKKAKKAASTGSTPSNKKGLSDIAQRDSNFKKKPLIIAICVLSFFLLASMITLAVVYNSKSQVTENTSTAKNEGIKNEFVSEAELDAKNAVLHPDFMPKKVVDALLKKGLNYKYYQKWEIDSLNEIQSLQPVSEGKILLLDLDYKKRQKYFAFEFSGYIDIPFTNTYEFTLNADDMCLIEIDDKELIHIQNLEEYSKSAKAVLEKGLHSIKILYLQKEDVMELTLDVSSPRFKKQKLPYSWLKRKELPQ